MPNSVRFEDDEGVITLHSDRFSLKIDNNRNVYYKKTGDTKFKSFGWQIERGYTNLEKKQLLNKLHVEILRRIEDSNNSIKDSREH